jgi:hypothetical protein
MPVFAEFTRVSSEAITRGPLTRGAHGGGMMGRDTRQIETCGGEIQ